LSGRWAALQRTSLGQKFPQTIALEGKYGLPTRVELPSPLTVIFGLNGTGKSRMLQEISESYGDCAVVSLSELIHYLQYEIGKRTDVEGLVEENSPLSDDKVRSDAVQDLVRRDYDEIKWYAVQMADSPFQAIVGEDVVPIFKVKHAGQEYDFRTMGLGELSAHLLMWILAYTKERADEAASTPLLLDEPDAFMPPPSRNVILSYLVEEAFGRSSPIVVASHSLELIRPALDSNSAVYLAEAANSITTVGPSHALSDRVAGLFGQSAPVEWLIFCEDESAYFLSGELLRAIAPRFWQSCRLLWCKNGYSDLEKIWEHLPRPSVSPEGMMNFAFFADGDKVEDVKKAISKTGKRFKDGDLFWPLLCLPGDPDALMKGAAELESEWLAGELRMTSDSLKGLLESLRGREVHNWVEGVLGGASVDRQGTLRALATAFVKMARPEALDEFRNALTAAAIIDVDDE
jgi:predicted ATPase